MLINLIKSSSSPSYFCSKISSITSCFNNSISVVSPILKLGDKFSSSKKLFLTIPKQNESIVHILALFKYVICLCKLAFSGSSSSFLYIASKTLSLISEAAAFVKVTTNNLSISIFSSNILLIILSTSTAVLPLPAAAATSIFEPFS